MADKRLSTPVGTAVYPRLKTPDTKFDDLGAYKADISIPAAEAAALITELTDIWKAHVGKAPKKADNPMFSMETDDQGEETGNVIFKMRAKNKMNKNGELWDRRPKLFDASLNPIDVNPYGGTKYVVSFEARAWEYGDKKGVSLQPLGVQIIELIEGGSATNAAAMGFAAQDGYASPAHEGAEAFRDESGDYYNAGDKSDVADTPDNGDY